MCFPQVRVLHGIQALVQLFSSDNQEVLRYATGATRNLIYENTENKVVLADAGGVTRLIGLLSEPDEELRKTITGVSPRPAANVTDPLSYADNPIKTCCGCRNPVESVLQRQPEGEAVQGGFISADRERSDSSVQEHPTVPIGEGDLLQHHWLPQVIRPVTCAQLCFSSYTLR